MASEAVRGVRLTSDDGDIVRGAENFDGALKKHYMHTAGQQQWPPVRV